MAGLAFGAFGICASTARIGPPFAGMFPTHRQCQVNISNACSTFTLCNPRWYSSSGGCASPFPPIIPPSASGNALFIKTPHTARGAVGVFTFDLQPKGSEKIKEKLAIMFSVPYDFTWYNNRYAVGVFDASTECDKHLFKHMYKEKSKCFIRSKANGSSLTYRGEEVTVFVAMSDAFEPVIKLYLRETD